MVVKSKNRLSEQAKAAVQQVANLATTVAPVQAKAETTVAQAMVPGAKPKELSDAEQKLLARQENRIEKAQRSFTEIAAALKTIRDDELYREHYTTFSAYTANRWEFTKFDHNRWLNVIEVLDVLRDNLITDPNDLPQNEGQARQLYRVLEAQESSGMLQVWRTVLERHESGERISGNLIAKVYSELFPTEGGDDEGEGEGEAPSTAPGGKAVTMTVTVGNSAEAQAIAEKFAPNVHGPSPVKGGYSVVIGADNAQVLSILGKVFDEKKVKDMTIRLVSNS